MQLKTIQTADIRNKKILLRVDFNVRIKNRKAQELFKIQAAKKTLDYLIFHGAKVALLFHFGRPEGRINPEFSLAQIKENIENVLGVNVIFADDCLDKKIPEQLNNLREKEVLLLENVRFYPGEEKNEENFAKKLTVGFDVFVNEAFSVCHRDQASVTGVTKFLPSYAGFWLQKEIEMMEKIKNCSDHPAVAIIGGAKIETKLPVIKFFEEKYDSILIGGKIANEALDQNIQFSSNVILPKDFIDVRLDIGPETISQFRKIIAQAKMIVWNGPLGKFEEAAYSAGTKSILESVLESPAQTFVGGGETIEVLERYDAMEKISFVSTGGGAMLEYLSKNKMPGIEALKIS